MKLIDPTGLFNGRRLRLCSNGARLRWPHYFCASNGFGRFKLDPYEVTSTVFAGFAPPVSEEQFIEDMREYKASFLLFVYSHGDDVWGQWSCPEHLLPKYKNAEDRTSPSPPEAAIKKWLYEYKLQFRAPAHSLLELEDFVEKRKVGKVSGEKRDSGKVSGENPVFGKSSGENRDSGKVSGEKRDFGKVSAVSIESVVSVVPVVSENLSGEISAAASCFPSSEYVIEDFPKAAAAIRNKFPTTDDKTVLAIIEQSLVDQRFSDDNLAECLTTETKKNQSSAGLYLTTIPLAMTRWAEREFGKDWRK